MIRDLFQVIVEIPDHINMNSKSFTKNFLKYTKESIKAETQDHDWRYISATFTSFDEAKKCERKLKSLYK